MDPSTSNNVLEYREKTAREKKLGDAEESPEVGIDLEDAARKQSAGLLNQYSSMVCESKNVIFHGAPGTGKSYLAKQIAADIVSGGTCDKYEDLTDEQKERIQFVQFHPSYDYTDFVEGLRPIVNDDGSMGFELRDGVFKSFVDRARKNWEDSHKETSELAREQSARETMESFFSDLELGVETFPRKNSSKFIITDVSSDYLHVSMPENGTYNSARLKISVIQRMLESDRDFKKVKEVGFILGANNSDFSKNSLYWGVWHAIREHEEKQTALAVKHKTARRPERENYVFIIDEINRGEISKIFGELFFSIDPGYRGESGAVSTQYFNLHDDPSERFYIPENVYIIGTMNDIDRSVDSFDFAMRRRFRFIELKANECLGALEGLSEKKKQDAIERMETLNEEIGKIGELGQSYQIGAAYFKKLKELKPEELWNDHLEPLLRDYVQGMPDASDAMGRFKTAFFPEQEKPPVEGGDALED